MSGKQGNPGSIFSSWLSTRPWRSHLTFTESTQSRWKIGRKNHTRPLVLKTRKLAFLDGEHLYISVKTKHGLSDASDSYHIKSFINLTIPVALSWFLIIRFRGTCLFIEKNISVLIANESPPAPNSTFLTFLFRHLKHKVSFSHLQVTLHENKKKKKQHTTKLLLTF